jgi:hypothetical protein
MSTEIDIEDCRRRNLPHLTFTDVMKVTSGSLTHEEMAAINAYLHQFTEIPDDERRGQRCPGCNAMLGYKDGMMGYLLGATFVWGLVHGQGFCRECHYPARLYHFNVGPIERFEMLLAFHPEAVMTRAERAAEDARIVAEASRGQEDTL